MKRASNFGAIVHGVLASTAIRDLLVSNTAVVLERIARGAGATNWYYCSRPTDLDAVEGQLRPGSVVSWYFDGRIRRSPRSPELSSAIEKIISETRDAVVGVLDENGWRINAEIVVSPDDLAEFMASAPPTSDVFYGAFPGRDSDGVRAVTVTLPDNDGVVRPHPH